MRKLQTIALAAFVVLAFSAITANSASASLVIECGSSPAYKNIVAKWNNQAACEAMSPFDTLGEWTWVHGFLANGVSVTVSVPVLSLTLSGKHFELEDMGVGVKVACEVSGEGTVKPEGKDETTSVAVSGCSVSGGTCTKLVEVKALHLPWKTQLAGTKTTVRDATYEGTGGNPGWLVKCETILGKIEDECTTTEGSAAVKNLSGAVEELFDESSGEANCSIGGAKEGLMFGAFEILSSTLDISVE